MADTPSNVTLNYMESAVTKFMGDLDKSTSALIDAAKDGGNTDVKSMVALQIGLQKYSTSATIISSIAKEIGDALKGVANKIS
ncbi:MAG: hypothetical protein EOO22_04320 [Comamonadaceae bacterium]|nr:MAG: hypothetical protein EOO22_04320 [Comamonadaceae bacterium]